MFEVAKHPVIILVVTASFLGARFAAKCHAQTGLEVEIAKFIFTHLAGKLLDEIIFDPVSKKPDLRDVQSRLEYLAQHDAVNSGTIYELKRQLAGCATREEVRAAMESVLRKIDSKLADQAARIAALESEKREHARKIADLEKGQDELYRQVGLTRQDIERLTGQVNGLSVAVKDHDRRLGNVEKDVDEMKKWKNSEMAMRLAVAGADQIEKGEYTEAVKLLTQAHAYAPEDPGVPYVLAIAYHLRSKDKDEEMAELWMAKGIASERLKIPPAWFINVLPRYQGRLRNWFDSRRSDPILGSKSSGDIRVVEIAPAKPVVIPTSGVAVPTGGR